MHIVGLSKDESSKTFYLTKILMVLASDHFEGYLHMSRNYIRMKTIYFMVHKDAIPAEIRAKGALNNRCKNSGNNETAVNLMNLVH